MFMMVMQGIEIYSDETVYRVMEKFYEGQEELRLVVGFMRCRHHSAEAHLCTTVCRTKRERELRKHLKEQRQREATRQRKQVREFCAHPARMQLLANNAILSF